MVFVRMGGQKTPVARLTLTTSTEDGGIIQIQGGSETEIAKVREVIERLSQPRLDEPDAETPQREALSQKWMRLVAVIENEGYGVEDIPPEDYQIKFEVDMRSGHHVGTQSSLHDFAAVDEPLGRRIVASLAEVAPRISNDLAHSIEVAVASGDPGTVASAIRQGKESGAFGVRPTDRLLVALVNIDLAKFEAEESRMVRECRVRVAEALRRYDIASSDVEALLREPAGLDDSKRAAFRMIIAVAAIKRGHRETALHIWRELLQPPTVLDSSNRAWAWRNISLALPSDSAEARRAAKCSADAFLESGEKREAATSLMRLVDCLITDDPISALKTLDEIVSLIGRDGLQDRYLRGAALHARAVRLAQLHKHDDALADALAAADLLRGLIGDEEQLVSTLHLAAIEAEVIGNSDTARACQREADHLTNEIGSSRFILARRVRELMGNFNREDALALVREAELEGNPDILASIRVIQATRDTVLGDTERLSLLEYTLRDLDEKGVDEAAKQPARLALAGELLKLGQPVRAEAWYNKILTTDPFDGSARDALVQILWDLEKWGDAAIILKKQINLLGEMPGLLYAYGRSLYEAGEPSGAVTALTQAMDLATKNPALESAIREMREKALRKGGTILALPQDNLTVVVTREEFDAALDFFKRHISSEKRMGFWKKSDNRNHTWISHPERHAQGLLHTYLKARFLDRVNVFQELSSGAGRLDLYLQLYGGLSLIIELKMCGARYSSAYAASGEDQIIHYMQNRTSHLGYLIVFDARERQQGQALVKAADPFTVLTKFVDVRPHV
jgi:tetratricopeptide (TPR) repeat protein